MLPITRGPEESYQFVTYMYLLPWLSSACFPLALNSNTLKNALGASFGRSHPREWMVRTKETEFYTTAQRVRFPEKQSGWRWLENGKESRQSPTVWPKRADRRKEGWWRQSEYATGSSVQRSACGSLVRSPSYSSSFSRAMPMTREFAVILNVDGKCASVQCAITRRTVTNDRVWNGKSFEWITY